MPPVRTTQASSNLQAGSNSQQQSRVVVQSLTVAQEDRLTHKILPAFISKDVRLWFITVENIFEDYGINSDRSRVRQLLQHLDSSILQSCGDIIQDRTRDRYERMKLRIFQMYDDSRSKKLQDLIQGANITATRPSMIWQAMIQLAGESAPAAHEIIKQL